MGAHRDSAAYQLAGQLEVLVVGSQAILGTCRECELPTGAVFLTLTPPTHLAVFRKLERTRQAPPDGSTHWSLRKMAAVMKVSKNLIARIWKEAELKPHRLDRYMASDDPQFEEKAADIIGLYLNPPQNVAVFRSVSTRVRHSSE